MAQCIYMISVDKLTKLPETAIFIKVLFYKPSITRELYARTLIYRMGTFRRGQA